MKEKLLEIFKLAKILDEKQDQVYADIEYIVNKDRTLVISIRSKKNHAYLEKASFLLSGKSLIKIDDVIVIFKHYIYGGKKDE